MAAKIVLSCDGLGSLGGGMFDECHVTFTAPSSITTVGQARAAAAVSGWTWTDRHGDQCRRHNPAAAPG